MGGSEVHGPAERGREGDSAFTDRHGAASPPVDRVQRLPTGDQPTGQEPRVVRLEKSTRRPTFAHAPISGEFQPTPQALAANRAALEKQARQRKEREARDRRAALEARAAAALLTDPRADISPRLRAQLAATMDKEEADAKLKDPGLLVNERGAHSLIREGADNRIESARRPGRGARIRNAAAATTLFSAMAWGWGDQAVDKAWELPEAFGNTSVATGKSWVPDWAPDWITGGESDQARASNAKVAQDDFVSTAQEAGTYAGLSVASALAALASLYAYGYKGARTPLQFARGVNGRIQTSLGKRELNRINRERERRDPVRGGGAPRPGGQLDRQDYHRRRM